MRRLVPVLAAALILPLSSCADGVVAPPPGCKFSSQNAWTLGEEYQQGLGVSWGDPIQTSFDGTRFRLLYETPTGEDERALIVDCVTGDVEPG